jgi:NTP pyrophosphatase (non-canonical NTP hydrolase)
MDIEELALEVASNSRRWFPSNHTSERVAITHCTLGLAGEAGEVANKVKKLYGYMDQRNQIPEGAYKDIVEELVDTLIYDLMLLWILCDDIPFAIRAKIAVCEERWGKR